MAVVAEMRLQAHEVDDEGLESMVMAVSPATSSSARRCEGLDGCQAVKAVVEQRDVLEIFLCPYRDYRQFRRMNTHTRRLASSPVERYPKQTASCLGS
jgi:hypothetical protein